MREREACGGSAGFRSVALRPIACSVSQCIPYGPRLAWVSVTCSQ